MGKPMAKHLLNGRASRHRPQPQPAGRGRARRRRARPPTARRPRSHGRVTVVITMLPDTADVDAVLTGANGVLSALQRGAVIIDMSSISPVATEAFRRAGGEKARRTLDAPVSGGEIGAINADAVDHGRRRRRRRSIASARSSTAWATPSGSIYIGRVGRGTDLQDLQSDRDRRRAGRRQRGVRAREEGRRRRGARAAGAARRLRGEPRPRSPRRADAERQLQAGIPHEAVPRRTCASRTKRRSANGVAIPATAIVAQLINALVASGGARSRLRRAGDSAV